MNSFCYLVARADWNFLQKIVFVVAVETTTPIAIFFEKLEGNVGLLYALAVFLPSRGDGACIL